MSTTPMRDLLDIQRQAFLADGFPSAKTRIDRIDRVEDIHVRYKQQIVEALEADFGARPCLLYTSDAADERVRV